MRGLFIDGIGAFTSIGCNVPQTMGSLRTGFTRQRELEIFGPDGNRVVACPSDVVNDGYLGFNRLAVMGAAALRECAREHDDSPLPVLLCCPEPSATSWPSEALLSEIARLSAVGIDVTWSRSFYSGHAAIGEALAFASRLLTSHPAHACYIGGAESLIDPDRIAKLMAEGRVRNGEVSDGLTPGEGAAFLRVSARPGRRRPLAVVQGLSVYQEEATRRGEPVTGASLARAIQEALRQAGATLEDLDLFVTDLNGERSGFTELAFAMTRTRLKRKEPLDSFAPARLLGEIGPVLGIVGVAYIAFKMGAGGAERRGGLYVGRSEGGLRAAVYLNQVTRGA